MDLLMISENVNYGGCYIAVKTTAQQQVYSLRCTANYSGKCTAFPYTCTVCSGSPPL